MRSLVLLLLNCATFCLLLSPAFLGFYFSQIDILFFKEYKLNNFTQEIRHVLKSNIFVVRLQSEMDPNTGKLEKNDVSQHNKRTMRTSTSDKVACSVKQR